MLAAVGLALLAAAAGCSDRLRARRIVLVAAGVAAALVGLAAAHRIEDRINGGRYLGIDRAVDALLRSRPPTSGSALAGDWSVGGLSPVWPAFGTRIDNDVEYVGEFGAASSRRTDGRRASRRRCAAGATTCSSSAAASTRRQPTPEQRWAMDAGWRTVALSPRLRVLVAPGVPASARLQPLADDRLTSRSGGPRNDVMTLAIRAVSTSTSVLACTNARACAPAARRAGSDRARARRAAARPARRHRRGGARKPHGASTHSGRPTSSLATTSSPIAIASLTTTGIESRSPSRGDDARHRQHVGALELGAHLGRRAAAEQLDPPAAALGLLGELRAQRPVADDPQPHVGQRAIASSSTSKPFFSTSRPIASTRAALRQRRAALERRGVDAHDDLVQVRRRHRVAQVARRCSHSR